MLNKVKTTKMIMAASFALAGLLVSSAVMATGKTHWGYSGEAGPQHWGKLSADYYACATSKNQSPINMGLHLIQWVHLDVQLFRQEISIPELNTAKPYSEGGEPGKPPSFLHVFSRMKSARSRFNS